MENYSAEIYSTIVKSINQWLPPFSKSDEKEAMLFFEKQLGNSLTVAVESLQKRIEGECEANYELQKQETVETYQKELDKLWAEISSLKEENAQLKASTKTVPATEVSADRLEKTDSPNKEVDQENIDPVSVVQEPVIGISEDYESMSMPELKKIAKEKKIKGYTKIEVKEDLIKLIRKAPTLL